MSAPGRPRHDDGNAPNPGGPPPTANPVEVAFTEVIQSITIKNVAAGGGADLTVSFDEGANYFTLAPREVVRLQNIRVKSVKLRSGTAGSVCPYEIISVEQ